MILPKIALDHYTKEKFNVVADVIFPELANEDKIRKMTKWITERSSDKFWIGYDMARFENEEIAMLFKLSWL